MNDQDQLDYEYGDEDSWIGMSVAFALVLMLLIGAFVWFVIQFDPLTSDFINTDTPVSTATTAPE